MDAAAAASLWNSGQEQCRTAADEDVQQKQQT
jgi:hypothetical protein